MREEAQINGRAQHADEAPASQHWHGYHYYGFTLRPGSERECLSRIFPRIARRVETSLQLTLQKLVRTDPAHRLSLSFGVQHGCVGKVVRGRNKTFQQSTQFRGIDLVRADITATR